jgi:hypothetical protein
MAQASSDAQLAAEAAELVRADQMPNLRADLLVVLADMLHARGLASSDEAMREAARLYRLKGNLASGRRPAQH